MSNTADLLRLAKSRLSEIEHEAKRLRDLINFYEPSRQERESVPSLAAGGEGRPKGGGRTLSPRWAALLRFVGEQGDTDYDAMSAFVTDRNYPISRDNLRSQMSIYHSRGWVEPRGDGVWVLTTAGRQKVGLRNGSAGVQEEQLAHSSTFESKGDLLSHTSPVALLNSNAAQ